MKTTTDWLQRKERGSKFLLRFMVTLAQVLGRRISRVILWPITLYFWATAGDARRASKAYLSRSLGRKARWFDEILHIYIFASTILDRVYFAINRHDCLRLRHSGRESMHARMDEVGGVFLFGAHLGSFEAIRALGHQPGGRPLVLLMYPENAQNVTQIMAKLNPNVVQEVIQLGQVDCMLQVQEALNRGCAVGVLADRSLQDDSLQEVSFLGGRAMFPTSAFRLAAVLKRPVFLMLGVYEGGNSYHIVFEEIADFGLTSGTQRLTRQAAIAQAVTQYADRLAHYCHTYPFNWFNFYDFWKKSS